MNLISKYSCAAFLALCGPLWGQTASTDPVPLFKLNFDQGFEAVAKGGGAPTNTNLPELVEGISGKAALFKQGKVLRYLEKGNLDKQRGSISMWIRACVNGNGTATADAMMAPQPALRHTLLKEDGPNKVGSNALWFWLNAGNGGSGVRFDVRDPQDSYYYVADILNDWREGEWHHVVATWDVEKGTQLYVDGILGGERFISKWTTKDYDAFFIGAIDEAGNQPWGAAIDEVTIYDRPLTAEQVRTEYAKFGKYSMRLRPVDPYLTAGQPDTLKIAFTSPAQTPQTISSIRYKVADADGKTVLSGSANDLSVNGNATALLSIPALVKTQGVYGLTLDYVDGEAPKSFQAKITAVAKKESAPVGGTRTLVAEVDAAKQEPAAASGNTEVVTSPMGAYREAGKAMRDRFLMEFKVKDVGAPYLAVITYPDDKPRTMEVMLQDLEGTNDYQAQTGVFTGDEYALSNKLREHSFVFWPHSTKQSLIFMTAEEGHPAAVKDIKIYRLDQIAVSPVKGVFHGSVPARDIGIYYEDCVFNQNFGLPPGQEGFAKSIDRMLDYMQSFGQNTLCYPIVWYNGPLYGTLVENREPDTGGDIGGDRPHPKGFPAYFAKRLAARGMKFNAGLHIHWLPSLNPYTITDIERVKAGEETVANVRCDGKIWWGHWHGADQNFNPIDPRVLGAVKAIVNEIGERYGSEPGFEGVTFVMPRPKLFQFGSIESGYNDINLRGFQQETGVTIPPYSAGNPDRFKASYQWLMANPEAKKAWIDWRCRKLHDHYKSIADALTARRADLKITLNYFLPVAAEGRVSDYLSAPAVEAMKEAGIDPALYAHDANIVMSYTLVPAEHRWKRSLSEKFPAVADRRTAMLAPEAVASFEHLPQTSVVLHDRYWEDPIGKTKPLPGIADAPKAKECTWRVSTLNGGGYNSMETYAAAVNDSDPQKIAKGGFLIGTYGMEKELLPFSAAFRALPAVRFDDVQSVEDPVRVRQKVVDGHLYFYALNRLPVPVTVKIALMGKGNIEEPATGAIIPSASQLTVELPPFGLRSFHIASAGVKVTGGEPVVAREWIEQLGKSLGEVREKVKARPAAQQSKAAPYLAFAERCWQGKQYARLHFLLQEGWAK